MIEGEEPRQDSRAGLLEGWEGSMDMREISYKDLQLNPMTMFGDEWLALAAGNEQGWNAMTVAWGHLGAIWDRKGQPGCLPTAIAYVRPSRYTKAFMDREELFTLSLFGPEKRKALAYIGAHSGRDGDKCAEAGLSPVFEDGTVYLAEAKLVLVCRKLYQSTLSAEGFVDPALLDENYPKRDLHDMYVGEIIRVLVP